MSLPRLLLAWLVATLWFVLWHEGRRRLGGGPVERSHGESRQTEWLAAVLEALLLTMFAALWFASLGHGGWPLLFLFVGILVEVPLRLRQHRSPILPWREVALGLIRIIVAGGLLAWRLG
jgi:hypothetical protein